MNSKTFIVSALLLGSISMSAQSFFSDVRVDARLGYNIGGTAPIGMPASIRKLNSFSLQPNLQIGAMAEKPINSSWGITVSLLLENKGMKEDAEVKNYHMAIVRGGQSLEGVFTGDVTTDVTEWMFTIPVQATWHPAKRWRIHLGPYISVLTDRSFTGYAHDGYLRVGNPTGEKVELGNTEGTRGDYDFSDHMRYLQWGMAGGADYRFTRHWSAFASLSWGLSGIHHANFHTIEQTLYPIFGNFGVTYRMK